jgi:2-aminoadipate transaminase
MTTFPDSFVREYPGPELALADWTRTMKRSVLREMLAVVSRPGILSFAGGLPDPELFPVKEFAGAVSHVLASDAKALQYGPPFLPLKGHIVSLMAQRGVICHEGQIFITTGAQQALNVLTHLFLNNGGQVLIEELVYSGIQQAIAPFNPDILTVTTDLRQGMDVDMVEAHLLAGNRPSFVYAISEAHNPLGVSLSPNRQQRLVDLARRYGLPIIEDDPYGLLRYESSAALPMRALDEEWVFYVGSFSKILAPALRLGWMVAPEFLIPKLTVIKESSDLETSAFIQRSVAAYLDAGHLPAHLERLRWAYRLRRDTMLKALARYFPLSATWTKPTGGMFIWVELPGHIDTAKLLWRAVEELQVAFIPGTAFEATAGSTKSMAGNQANHCLRLNFSTCSPETIEEGIGRLGALLHEYC